MIVSGSYLSTMLNNKMKKNQNSLQTAMERLSSGKKINRAADDAAGLAISKKMQALIRGTQQASRNVQDAGSLVQTAEGGMEEITSILQRIRELSVQAANDTVTRSDRVVIQDEIDELNKAVNDIVINTEFNTKKLLTNTTPGEYLYENRTASKTSQLSLNSNTTYVQVGINQVGTPSLPESIVESNTNFEFSPAVEMQPYRPVSYIGTTVVDHLPQWSLDGESIVFQSSRVGGQYVVPADVSRDPEVSGSVATAPRKTRTEPPLMQLYHSGSNLYVQARSSTSHGWSTIQTISNYNSSDGSNGYSFSPRVDEEGNTSFVYSDNEGNIRRVDVNLNLNLSTLPPTVINPGGVDLIPNTDRLHIPVTNNTLTLPTTPDLYRMDDRINASLQIEKVNDSGSKVLTYWDRDENGDPPSGYYFTVSGNAVTFWGDAIIGAEDVDDAQDFYRFSYVSDGVQDNIHTVSIPPLAEVYNMNGEEGPHSMRIQVGGDTVRPDQLLAARPSAEDIETTHGVYVDQSTGRIEFYGDLRPAYNQEISIRYREDDDGRNDVYTFTLPNGTGIDTYNLENEPDLELNRSLRVFTRTGSGVEQELLYDGENGYTYNPSNGQISLHGNARPDLPSGTTIRVEYMRDLSGSQTTTEVYGIPLDWRYPEVYNIETDEEPKSIRVYRNGEEISFSETEGFFYNEETNTIELNGMARPDTGDLYSIHMIRELGGVSWRNGVVEVGLSTPPETYGIADPDIPSTFRVVVDGREVHYDPFQLDGFYYNSDTNRIELYGESRPDAGHASDPDVQVYYVYESSAATRGNDTYDFRLNSSSLSYGVGTDEEPQAIRVYLSGVEIPYSEEHGYTYNTDTNILSLHGDFRPDGGNDRGDYRVYSVSSNSITIPVPTNSYVYEVHVNGQEIPETDSIDGNGYYFDGRMVQLVGDARPNITNTTGSVRMNVSYYDSLDIHLNNSPSMPDYLSSCGCGEDAHLLFSEIDPTELSVYFNGTTLTDEQFSLQGNRIVLDKDKVDVQLGANTIEVDYRLRYVVGYEANDFTFQVGANAGQNYLVEIQSFDNMLMDTNQICVLTHEEASASINLVDKALSFVNAERSHVGAVSNRLNSMASNLSVLEENTTAAVSRIEDADMAKEAMNLMRANVLSQAQTAMHAQMNQSSHRVLELLR